jgi:hypothetical protein
VFDRGIIVADACSLRRLQAGVRQEFYEDGVSAGKPVRRYLDLLPFLGEHGFRIIVPEMVSMEMGGVLLGAPNVDDLFSDSRRNQEATDTVRPLKLLLERAKSGKMAGMAIRPSDPATDHGQYLDSLRDIAADPALSRKRKCDLLAVAQNRDQRDFGERACLDAIAELVNRPGGPGVPVFFLSDDRAALRECHGRFGDRVGRLNTKGFLGGFTRTGLFERLHLKAGLVHAMSRDLLEQNGDASGANGKPVDMALVDNGRAPHEGNDLRFERQMEVLAQELRAGVCGKRTDEGQAVPAASASRSERFRQKWGWSRATSGRDGL